MVILYSLTLFFLTLLYSPCSLRFTLCLGESILFSADSSSYIFLLTLFLISVSVLIWSYYYMDSDLVYRRFFGIVLAFLLAMFLLVFSADLLSLFVA